MLKDREKNDVFLQLRRRVKSLTSNVPNDVSIIINEFTLYDEV